MLLHLIATATSVLWCFTHHTQDMHREQCCPLKSLYWKHQKQTGETVLPQEACIWPPFISLCSFQGCAPTFSHSQLESRRKRCGERGKGVQMKPMFLFHSLLGLSSTNIFPSCREIYIEHRFKQSILGVLSV